MVLPSFEIFPEQNPNAVTVLGMMSEAWKGRRYRVTMVVEGIGEVFWARYWRCLDREARMGNLFLWLTDVNDPDMARRKAIEANSNVAFLNKSKPQDLRTYKGLEADIVLVLVPDMYHIPTIDHWIGLENPPRALMVFVEKPYDRNLEVVQEFHRRMHEKRLEKMTMVIPFDHYVAKAFDFVKQRDRILTKIGGRVTGVKFSMTEVQQLTARQGLEYGVMFDMACHMMALASTVLSLDNPVIEEVKAGVYKGAPDKVTDTFDYMKLLLRDGEGNMVPVEGRVGKAVGKSDDKYFQIEGPVGSVNITYAPKEGITLALDDGDSGEVLPVRNGYEYFLEKLIRGEFPIDQVGVLPRSIAFGVINVLTVLRARSKESVEYPPNVSVEEIERLLNA